jgi:hypothetical protein
MGEACRWRSSALARYVALLLSLLLSRFRPLATHSSPSAERPTTTTPLRARTPSPRAARPGLHRALPQLARIASPHRRADAAPYRLDRSSRALRVSAPPAWPSFARDHARSATASSRDCAHEVALTMRSRGGNLAIRWRGDAAGGRPVSDPRGRPGARTVRRARGAGRRRRAREACASGRAPTRSPAAPVPPRCVVGTDVNPARVPGCVVAEPVRPKPRCAPFDGGDQRSLSRDSSATSRLRRPGGRPRHRAPTVLPPLAACRCVAGRPPEGSDRAVAAMKAATRRDGNTCAHSL